MLESARTMRIKRLMKKVAIILLGAAIFTFGVHNIHEVTGITEGGVIGLMLFLNKWFGIPSSIASPVLDIICYAVALKMLGGGFLGWSAVATAAVAGFYRVWESLPHMLPDLSANPFAAAVLGGLCVGVGVGLVVRQGGSAGGDDALALSISKATGWRVGRCYLFTDLTVLALLAHLHPRGQHRVVAGHGDHFLGGDRCRDRDILGSHRGARRGDPAAPSSLLQRSRWGREDRLRIGDLT